jgi:hypothetical protein
VKCVSQLIEGRDRGQIRPQGMQSRNAQVMVGVDETRKEFTTGQVANFGPGPRRQDLAWPNRRDSLAADDDDLGVGVPRIHGYDGTACEGHKPPPLSSDGLYWR